MTHRILHIIPTLDRSGAEKQLMLLAGGLPRDEFEVHVCAMTRGGPYVAELERSGIPVTVIGKRWKIDPAAYWRLERLIRSLRPDLVQTWLFAANAYGRAAARRAGVEHLIAGERCVDRWKVGYEFAIDRFLARWTQRIVVNSGGVRDFYVGHGIPSEKFVVIPNGVEAAASRTTVRTEILDRLGLPPDARLIGTVGRLWPQKRVKDLIWAADLLKVLRDDAHLLIIGDGPLMARLRRYRDQLAISDKVHFLGHRADVAELMPHFDLLWLASGYEGLPNVVMEAMSHGVPVVATDIPGCRDLITSGQTGFLVRVGDRAGFARYAEKILSDADLAARLGTAGRDRISAEFSVEKMIGRHADLYRKLLA